MCFYSPATLLNICSTPLTTVSRDRVDKKKNNAVAKYLKHSFYSEENDATPSIIYLLIMFVTDHFEKIS